MVQKPNEIKVAADETQPRLFVYSLGLLFQRKVHRILKAAGWSLHIGLPQKEDVVAVWGRKPAARRGIRIAKSQNVPLYTLEDAFLRSVKTGRQGAEACGIVVDKSGIYFDTSHPSDLQKWIVAAEEVPDSDLAFAARCIYQMQKWHLSKYNAHHIAADLPEEFILVIDQTYGDASIMQGGADATSFAEMLVAAKQDYPDTPILIKSHPEVSAGKRKGHFSLADCDQYTQLLTDPLSPWLLFERAKAVYCVTSQIGMEAIFADHKPVVFGKPFYAGLGLTEDHNSSIRAPLSLSKEQLFCAAYLRYPLWYDPFSQKITDITCVMNILKSQSDAWRQDHKGAVFYKMRLWKRGFLQQYFGLFGGRISFNANFETALTSAVKRKSSVYIWAKDETDTMQAQCNVEGIPLIRLEDGFLRSVGLGAKLVRPISLAADDLGIYYDSNRESRLERLINQSGSLTEFERERSNKIVSRIVASGLTKYNLEGSSYMIKPQAGQKVILVPGQVEDDASIQKAAFDVKTNLDLLQATRRENPEAYIVYKPHPDVEAKLRKGMLPQKQALEFADVVVANADMNRLLEKVDMVSTITSLTGFEALLRGKTVICYGMPFYAGWGLTTDKANAVERRKARPDITALAHAALIEYPRYWDPVTVQPCPIEVVLDRFDGKDFGQPQGRFHKTLAKTQGILATIGVWRR